MSARADRRQSENGARPKTGVNALSQQGAHPHVRVFAFARLHRAALMARRIGVSGIAQCPILCRHAARRAGGAGAAGSLHDRPPLPDEDVSPELYERFVAAPSKGHFFYAEIRDRDGDSEVK